MKKFLKNIVKLKKISTIKDFWFGTFPSISGSGLDYTFYRPPSNTPINYRIGNISALKAAFVGRGFFPDLFLNNTV